MQTVKADLVIVGAGLVGSTLAIAVAQQAPALRIVLIDAKTCAPTWKKDVFDSRVVALTERSIGLLQSLEVWPHILAQRACPYRAMEVWDGEGNGRIEFDCSEVHREQLGFIVENSAALMALRRTLSSLDNVQLLAPVSVTAWRQGEVNSLYTEDGREIQAPLLVGADGAHSQLRQWAHLQTREWDYDHHAIITTVKTQQPHHFVARQRFSHDGPLAFLPLMTHSGGAGSEPEYHSSIVWSLKPDIAAMRMALPEHSFCEQLARTFEGRLGEVECSDERICIPLRQRHVSEYGRPGFALIGDAAHTIHPLAGQGVNLGLYDAQALTAEILRAHQRSVPLQHESVVKRYQRERKVHNLLAMSAMEGFKRLFASDNQYALLARNRGLSLIHRLPWLKRELMQIAAGS